MNDLTPSSIELGRENSEKNVSDPRSSIQDCVSSVKAYASNKLDFSALEGSGEDRELKFIDQIAALEQEREALWHYANELEKKLEQRRADPNYFETAKFAQASGDDKLELLAREAAREHEQANSYRIRLKQMETVISWHEKQRLLALQDRRKVSETSHEMRILREKVQVYADELDRLKTENMKFSIDLKQSEERQSQNSAVYKKEVAFLEEELSEERERARSLSEGLKSAEEKLNARILESQSQQEVATQKILELERELAQLKAEISEARTQNNLEQEALRSENTHWRNEHNCVSQLLEEATRRLRDSQHENEKAEQLARELTDRLNAEKMALVGAESKLTVLHADKVRLNESLVESRHENATQERRLQEALNHEKAQARDLDQVRRSLEEAQAHLRETRMDLEDSKAHFESLQKNYDASQIEVENYRSQYEAASSRVAELTQKLNELGSYVTQLEGENRRLESDLERTTQDRSSLRLELARVSNALMENIEAKTSAEAELQKLGASHALQTEVLNSTQGSLDALKVRDAAFEVQIRELLAQLDNSNRQIRHFQADIESLNRGLISTSEERDQLESDLSATRTELESLKIEFTAASEEARSASYQLEKRTEQWSESERVKSEIEAQLTQLRERNSCLQTELANLELQFARCQQQLADQTSLREELQLQLQSGREALGSKQNELGNVEALLKRERLRVGELNELLGKQQKENGELLLSRDQSLDQICNLFREVEDTRRKVQNQQSENALLQKSLDQLSSENTSLKENLETVREQALDLRSKLESASIQNRQLNQDIRSKNEEISELRALNDSVSDCLRNEQAAQADRDEAYLREIKDLKLQSGDVQAQLGLAQDRIKRLESDIELKNRDLSQLNRNIDYINLKLKEERDQNLAYVSEHNQALKEAHSHSSTLERKVTALTQSLEFEKSGYVRFKEDMDRERQQQVAAVQGLQSKLAEEVSRAEEARLAIKRCQQENLRLESQLQEARLEVQTVRSEKSLISRESAVHEQALTQEVLKCRERVSALEHKLEALNGELLDREAKLRQLSEQSRIDFDRFMKQ